MKIFDKKTYKEILPKIKSRSSGTDRVIECLLNVHGGDITDIVFGSTSRSRIHGECLPRNIAFVGCKFNYVCFIGMLDCSFINCTFVKCEFLDMSDITMKNCGGFCNQVINGIHSEYSVSGTCVFEDCSEIYFNGSIDPNVNLTVKNTPELAKVLDMIEKRKRLAEDEILKNIELRKSIKFGYKVVNAPILVKLSFPDDAEFVNLDKDKSRASVAMVESIHIINDMGVEGVVNNFYKRCEYRVGELVYPDSFDKNPNHDCSHGIHFCKDLESLTNYGYLSSNQIKSLKSQNL